MKSILVADYVDPKMAARLRELDVPFVDTMGNAFINEKPLYIFIKGLKKKNKLNHDEVIGQSYGRIFQPTGLKILYALDLYRVINSIATKLNISYVVVGATARDYVLHYGYGADIRRATTDIDFGIEVESWVIFKKLKDTLLKN